MVNARKTFCQSAVGKICYPCPEVTCHIVITNSSVKRLAVSKEAADLKKYLKML